MEPRCQHFMLVFWLLSSSVDILFFMCQHFILAFWLLSSGVDTLFFMCRPVLQVFSYCLQVSTLFIFHVSTLHADICLLSLGVDTLYFHVSTLYAGVWLPISDVNMRNYISQV